MVTTLIYQGEKWTDEDLSQHNLLFNLVFWGDLDAIELLLNNGLDINNSTDSKKKTLLMFALQFQMSDVSKFLIEKGADLSLLDTSGNSVMDYAIQYEKVGILELIVAKDSTLRLNSSKNSVSTFFMLSGNVEMIELLREKCGFNVNSTDQLGRNLLHYTYNIKAAEYLIDVIDELNAVDDENYTALHRAIVGKHEEVAMFLIEKGADLSLITSDGSTPMDLAILENQAKIIQSLFDKGASLKSEIHFKKMF